METLYETKYIRIVNEGNNNALIIKSGVKPYKDVHEVLAYEIVEMFEIIKGIKKRDEQLCFLLEKYANNATNIPDNLKNLFDNIKKIAQND